MATAAELVAQAEALLAAAKQYQDDDNAARLDLIRKVDTMRLDLDRPHEYMLRDFTNFSKIASMWFALQTGALAQIPREEGSSISAKELAAKVCLDESMLVRMMRILTVTGTLKAVEENVYAHTRFSRAFVKGTEPDFWKLHMVQIYFNLIHMPEYAKTHSASDFSSPRHTPFSWCMGVEGEKNVFEYMQADPDRAALFNRAMTASAYPTPRFPFMELLSQPRKKTSCGQEEAFIVDIGGGHGQALLEIQEAYGEPLDGRMVLQEQPAVLDEIPDEALSGVQRMEYDFLTQPQPIKNAQFYLIRRVIHDWSDPESITILRHTAQGMGPDSRLLIQELLIPKIPEVHGEMSVYWMDHAMVVIGGKERSETEFAELFKKSGLKLVKVWQTEGSQYVSVEAKLDLGGQ